MARQQLSVEERRRRNREYQKKRREKIHSEPEVKEEYLRMERQRWKKRVEEGKVKNIKDLNEREKRSQRKAWKRRQQESRDRKRKGSDHPETPSESLVDQATHEPAWSRQAIAGERERKKTRARYSREMKAMRNKLQEVTKDRNKIKKRWIREQARNKKTQESPRKKTEHLLRGSQLKNPSIKKTLLFHNTIHEVKQNKSAHKNKNLTLSRKVLKKYRLIHHTRQFGVTNQCCASYFQTVIH